jgi:16S rRNA (uracil1498-N3)-methyltransferase
VTSPLFLLPPGSLDDSGPGSVVAVLGAEAHHAAAALRIRVGDEVLVGDGAGRRAVARVESADPKRVDVRVETIVWQPAADPSFVLVQALAKNDRDEQAVEAATELGVDAVVPWQAARSVVQWRADRVARGIRSWEALARAATKQSRGFRVPLVHPLARTAQVAELLAGAALGLVLHEEASTPLTRVELPPTGSVVVVVGPEGGIAPEELEAFATAGAQQVRLGTQVLRASSAGPAALAVLNARSRWG